MRNGNIISAADPNGSMAARNHAINRMCDNGLSRAQLPFYCFACMRDFYLDWCDWDPLKSGDPFVACEDCGSILCDTCCGREHA